MLSAETHFLLVDDYENIRLLLSSQLTTLGMTNISQAEDVDSAVAILESSKESNPVQFIISDWNMPGKNGLEFLKWARLNDSTKNTPFMILTTESEQAKILDAVQNGVSNFLLKPWQEEDLIEKIKICWDKHN